MHKTLTPLTYSAPLRCALRRALALLFLSLSLLTSISFASPAVTNATATPTGYTNHAGHVLIGTLLSADAKTATFRLSGDTTRTLPLTIFPPSERERIGIATDSLPPPPAVAQAFDRCRLALQRLDVLVKAGQQSEESATESRNLERQAVRAILADLVKQNRLTPAAAAYFTNHIP